MSEKTTLLFIGAVLVGVGCGIWKLRPAPPASAKQTMLSRLKSSPTLVTWPLSGATRETGIPGIKRLSLSKGDTTDVDFLEFDLKANPRLKLELLVQGKPDQTGLAAMPRSNAADALLANTDSRGRVVAVVNGGAFDDRWRNGKFDLNLKVTPLASLVNNGQMQWIPEGKNKGLWTFGVRQKGQPHFDVLCHATQRELSSFEFATGGVQCLIRNGQPLNIVLPLSNGNFEPLKECSPQEAGSLGQSDWIKTSRVSLGWNRDCSRLWMLSLHSSQEELASQGELTARLKSGDSLGFSKAGWTARDVQDFWKSQGAFNAVLVASGDYTQFACIRPDGRVSFMPSLHTNEDVRADGTLVDTAVVPRLYRLKSRRSVSSEFSGGIIGTGGMSGYDAPPNPNLPVQWERDNRFSYSKYYQYSRATCVPDRRTIPQGGAALFYWTVRESSQKSRPNASPGLSFPQ